MTCRDSDDQTGATSESPSKRGVSLIDTFSAAAKMMRAEFDQTREVLAHAGQKGAANESIVREFLRKHLPGNLDVCTGTVCDSTG